MPIQQILGIKFFDGDVDRAIEQICRVGGFLVVPAAPALTKLRANDSQYRSAMTEADLAIADSGAMVLSWRMLRGKKVSRISGLKYLQHLSRRIFAEKAKTFWILPNERARQKASEWLRANHFPLEDRDFYVAPIYGPVVEDRELLARIQNGRPKHIVIGIGNGPQEKLGHYLRETLSASPGSDRPAIHCIGAALGFLTGEQVSIPNWADRFYLGWLVRLFAQPRIFVPRLTRALELPWLILRYGSELPPARRRKIESRI